MHSTFMPFCRSAAAIFPSELSFVSAFYTHFKRKIRNPEILKILGVL